MAVLARKSSFQSIGRDERGVTTRTRAGPGFDVGTDGDEVDGDISGRTLCVMDVRVASGGASVDGRGCLFLGLVENFERVRAHKSWTKFSQDTCRNWLVFRPCLPIGG
jgi:hypothetical protein